MSWESSTGGAPDVALQQLIFDISGVLELIGGEREWPSQDVGRVLDLVAGLLQEALNRIEPTDAESTPRAATLADVEPRAASDALPEVQVLSLRDLLARARRASGALKEVEEVRDSAIEARFSTGGSDVPERRR